MATATGPDVVGEEKAVDKSGRRVRTMFASIARRYDLLNHLLSLNIDKAWRRSTTRLVPPEPGVPVLDCCTGTADLALAYDRASGGRSPVVGADFCHEMLAIGNVKLRKAKAEDRVVLIEGDAQRLPVPCDTFGVVSVAFGLRNVADTVRGIDEMVRAARPGGKVAILEFSRPRGPILSPLYLLFFRKVLPRVGQALAPNDLDAYNYLPQSVMQFPDGQEMLDLLSARTDRGPAISVHVRNRLALCRREAWDVGNTRRLWRGWRGSMIEPSTDPRTDLVLAITGASGAPYAVGLLRAFQRAGRTVHLTISPSGAQVLNTELDLNVPLAPGRFDPGAFGWVDESGSGATGRVVYHHYQDFTAGIASGSFPTAGMVIAPCSMSTLASIAHGITTNLVTRTADVHLKERRRLILVPRDAAEPGPPGEHGGRHTGRGDRAAGDAGLVSQTQVAR